MSSTMYGNASVIPTPEPRREGAPSRSIGIVVFAAVLAVATGSGFVTATATRSWFPSRWDPRVAPIAAAVARLRGLDFLHPVPIEYLAPKDFEKRLGNNGDSSSSQQSEIAREAAVFRALGLIGGKVDLSDAIDTSQSSGTLAYYDPSRQDIIVRGTTLDAEHRVTVAHEMTHVLQDQHFDLRKLQKQAADSKSGDTDALTAIVEGDAVRIQDAYLAQLSAADKQEYTREDDAENARVGKETKSVPDIVSLLSAAPYEFGPQTIQVLLDTGGNNAINDALTGPTPSSRVFVDAGDVSAPVAVDTPALPAGGVAVGDTETFGPFEMYLTLSMRLDPGRALEAADLVDGGTAVTFKRAGATCYRVAVSPTEAQSRAFLLAAVEAWAKGRPQTTLDAAGDLVGFTACDPGSGAPAPSSARFHTAVELLTIRMELTVVAAKEHLGADVARCIARVFVETPNAEQLVLAVGNGTPTAAQNTQLEQMGESSGEACRNDPNAGLK